ncbi:MAG: hypothetical protein EXR75_10985 [Myxococcales bacterium]|nr:hypothetical protein [Myxococcales bacterium]
MLGKIVSDVVTPFAVTADTLGFTVLVKSGAPYGRMGVRELSPPMSAPVIEDFTIPGVAREFSGYGLTAAGVPQSDALGAMPAVMPGTWNVTIGDPTFAENSGDVSVWSRKTKDGLFHGGKLDVNVFLIGGVTTEAYVTSTLAASFGNYVGISLGDVAFYPLDAKFSVIDEMNYFDLMQASSPAVKTPALNVFVVWAFAGELQDAIGIAAGIPGLGIAHGSNVSGVAWSPFDPNLDPLIFRHEAGHLAGLFHTTEILLGTGGDALADTPSCPDVEQLLGGCPDAMNIMFPYANDANAAFTSMQAQVIRGSTLYRSYFDDSQSPAKIKGGEKGAGDGAADGEEHGVSRDATRSGGAWRSRLGRAASFATAHWCTHGKHRFDHSKRLAQLASEAELLGTALDDDAPELVRVRSARALAHAKRPGRGALERLVRDLAAPRRVRLAALDTLVTLAPRADSSAALLARGFASDADADMARYAHRMMQRHGW